jgi:hypothetical protein
MFDEFWGMSRQSAKTFGKKHLRAPKRNDCKEVQK